MIFGELSRIGIFIAKGFLDMWPYLLVTVPIAVAIKMMDIRKHVTLIFNKNPYLSIVIATAIGGFSPFCACEVVPIVASLLIGGVPLAPVMSFWIASPSMDVEIFFLSVATVGTKLAIWRFLVTFAMSLGAGLLTHFLVQKRIIDGEKVLNEKIIKKSQAPSSCCVPIDPVVSPLSCCAKPTIDCCNTTPLLQRSLLTKILRESGSASLMILKFMSLALLLEAMIVFYFPAEWISKGLGSQGLFSVPLAALIGIPVYINNLTALPMVAGLIKQGMSEAAALAFLVSGPTTTIPAMAAVYQLARKKVFFLYVLIAFFGALIGGYLLYFIN